VLIGQEVPSEMTSGLQESGRRFHARFAGVALQRGDHSSAESRSIQMLGMHRRGEGSSQ
jgi:hypothetical protein